MKILDIPLSNLSCSLLLNHVTVIEKQLAAELIKTHVELQGFYIYKISRFQMLIFTMLE